MRRALEQPCSPKNRPDPRPHPGQPERALKSLALARPSHLDPLAAAFAAGGRAARREVRAWRSATAAVGREPVLVSAIVSLAITTQMNDALVRLMNRPESPNLCWALCELPDRRGIWRNAFYGERRFLVPATPHLADAIAGKDLSPQQWRTLLELIASLHAEPGKNAKPDPVEGATPDNVRRARELYAKSRGLEPEQVAKLDPLVVLGTFYVQQAEVMSDEIFKLRGLPYPALLRKSRSSTRR